MKKLTAMLLALTMACGVLAGCNGTPSIPGEESSTPSSTPAESSKAESSTPEVTEKNFDGVTVKVWGGDLLNNPDFEAFWAENAGGMKYEVVQADDVKMMSMVASGTAPDVWVLSAFSMGAMYAARGLYEPWTITSPTATSSTWTIWPTLRACTASTARKWARVPPTAS